MSNDLEGKSKEDLQKEKKSVEEVLSHLEEEYRNATVSENNYIELKNKNSKRLDEIDKKILQMEVAEQKKDEPEPEMKPLEGEKEGTEEEKEETMPEEKEESLEAAGLDIEVEKLKAMLDTVRESKHATDETLLNISETIGELRSMILQLDVNLKESMTKVEKIEDEIYDIKPQKFTKKLKEMDENFEKNGIEMEKLENKLSDIAERTNKVYEMLKSIGGVENLIELNKNVQEKLDDIKEATGYIERLGSKTEKIFIDMSRGLEDLTFIKARLEEVEDSMKELTKSFDSLDVRFEGYVSKSDMDTFKKDILFVKNQLKEMNKLIPIAEMNLPEEIKILSKAREDIVLLLESMEAQVRNGKMSIEEYARVKAENTKEIAKIENKIKKEWERLEKLTRVLGKTEAEPTKEESIVEVDETGGEGKATEETKPDTKEKKVEKSEKIETEKKELEEETPKPKKKSKEEKVDKKPGAEPIKEKIVEEKPKAIKEEKKEPKPEEKKEPEKEVKEKKEDKPKEEIEERKKEATGKEQEKNEEVKKEINPDAKEGPVSTEKSEKTESGKENILNRLFKSIKKNTDKKEGET